MSLTPFETPYLFFTGKGGVGKTSLACAVAILVLITALLWPLHRRAIHFRL